MAKKMAKKGKRMAMGGPAMSGGLPPVQNMGPGNMPPGRMPGAPRAALTQSAVQPPVDPKMLRAMAPGKMAPSNMGPMSGGLPPAKMPGAPRAALTQSGAQQGMMQNMGPNNMAPMRMRNGGMARKGKTMAMGGLAKGSGCASKGVKKPRYT